MPPSIHDGGSIESLSSSVARSKGLCGAMTLANTAATTQSSATTAAPIAIGELRNECQKSPSRKRAQRPGDGADGCRRGRQVAPRRRGVAAGRCERGRVAYLDFNVIHLKYM